MEPEHAGKFDTVVVGGGMAGVCAAISAARLGCNVALIQDRPILGGNSSSEIRVSIGGAEGHGNKHARETGIIEELRIEDRFRNHNNDVNGQINSVWDMILLEWVWREKNIKLYLNTTARRALKDGDNLIKSVIAEQLGTGKTLRFDGEIFIDCSGDGQVAANAGADFRMGREARHEHNESLAPEEADSFTLGSSLLFQSVDVGHPVNFDPPDWAYDYPTDESLPFRHPSRIKSGFWWIEYGGMLDTIKDNDAIRDELWKHVYGVWNHIKNYGEHGAENYALDWIGAIPGKRESRRFLGDHILTQSDLEQRVLFEDRVAYGGWPIDLHPPAGIYHSGRPAEFNNVGLYSIPFRCLYSRNIDNLMMAGRHISVTHVALGSPRLIATCAIEGQAVGTASYLCKKYNAKPRGIYKHHIKELQQQLLKDDCYIIKVKNEDEHDIARNAVVTESSAQVLEPSKVCNGQNVVNGVSRPEDGEPNTWISDLIQPLPQHIDLDFGEPQEFNAVYLTFDTHLDKLIGNGAVPQCVKDYTLYYEKDGEWVKLLSEQNNHHRRRIHNFAAVKSSKLRVNVEAANGVDTARIYEVRIYN